MNDTTGKNKELRSGFTTGSCAAAASKAAAYLLLTGDAPETVDIMTPKGIVFRAEILDASRTGDSARCAVRKDGGDDPDVTTGLLIYSEVRLSGEPGVRIRGGEGVGLVTRPGLDQPVGNHAINSVPRRMIEQEVSEVLEQMDCAMGADVVISIPGGRETALKTFNPRLGIEGGISVIGTSGVVEPMSVEALIDTIKVELRQRRAEGEELISIAPGIYGLNFMKKEYGFDLDRSVKISNFVGAACDEIVKLGFRKMLLAGHAGKLVKVAGGIMNTHSHEADSRMEIIAASAFRAGASRDIIEKVLDSNTTEEAFGYLAGAGLAGQVSDLLVRRAAYYLDKRMGGEVEVECVMFVNDMGLLGCTPGAAKLIEEIKEQWKEQKSGS